MSFQKYLAEVNKCAALNGGGFAKLTQLDRRIETSRQLDDEEKEELRERILYLQGQLNDVESVLSKSVSNNDSEDSNWCRHEYPYDDYVTHQDKEPWEKLNKDNLPYPKWLSEVAIKEFFPYLPNLDVVAPIIAASCFINAVSVPPASQLVDDEVSVPRLYISGASGIGKTRLARFIGKHYRGKAFQLFIPEGFTAVRMRNIIHATCTGGRESLRPSCVCIDNVYAHQLTNPSDNFVALRTALLADKRSQAFSGTGRPGDQEDKIYQLLTFYILTSINPISAVSMKAREIQRRCIPINCGDKELPDLIKRYDFSKSSDIYASYWTPEQWSKSFIKLLGECSQVDPADLDMEAGQWGISQLLIATGVHVGIWTDIIEAIELMTEFWQLVGDENKTTDDAVLLLINTYFDEVLPRKEKRTLQGKEVYKRIGKDDLCDYIGTKTKVASGGNLEKQVTDIMGVRGYKLIPQLQGELYFIKEDEL